MLANLFFWAWNRFRPAQGWLSLFLLLAAVLSLTTVVVDAGWVSEGRVVAWMAPLGLLLGVVLAGRPLRALPAWLLLLAYGLVLNLLYLARVWPPLSLLFQGEAPVYMRTNWAIFADRAGSWLLAATSGGRSRETIVFALGLGLVAWLLAAYAAWATYRQRRPLVALVLVGGALGLNNYFSGSEAHVWAPVLFLGFATLLAAVMHFANLEQQWQQRAVDYSPEIRMDLYLTAAAVALLLPILAYSVPAIRFSSIARAFQQTPAVQQAEDTLERVFSGVNRPPRETFATGGTGVLPRAYLLGNPPSLHEIVVMTATLSPAHPVARHWRAASYDVYTGRGWTLSSERSAVYPEGTPLEHPPAAGQTVFTQTVQWLDQNRAIHYTMGLPLEFSGPTTTYWRGLEDFSRARSNTSRQRYQAHSRLTTAGPALLRESSLPEIPPILTYRYTNLPENFPERIRQLAQEIAAPYSTPYDQALALETFLRQYPYSLDVEPPPAGRDPVDYFLFDLQRGYCDYYASAMVVLARSLGFPARLATGFLAQEPDEKGVQTIYQANGHSWPELYFAGYGWVEFEPTAGYPPAYPDALPQQQAEPPAPGEPPPPSTLPLPPADPGFQPSLVWWLLLPAVLFFLLVLRRQGHTRRAGAGVAQSGVSSAYGRLQQMAARLGQPIPASQTPAEFAALFLYRLAARQPHPRLQRWLAPGAAAVERLTELFIRHQYAPPATGGAKSTEARSLWRVLSPRLWLLWLLKPFFKRRFLKKRSGKD